MESPKLDIRYIIYIAVVIFCIIAMCIGVYAQFFYENAENDKLMIGSTEGIKQAEIKAQESEIKDKFENIFTNSLVYVTESINSQAVRADKSKDLIYTINQVSKTENGKYEMNINLPCFNLSTNTAKNINSQIEKTFLPKATSLITDKYDIYKIYNIDYAGFVNYNILSLVIKATLKEGNNPQRAMYMTYNYNLDNSSTVQLNDILSIKNIKQETLQNKINKEIKEISKKNEDLKNLGYTVYTRKPEDNMYKVENTKMFFMGPNSYAYILYAYGNDNHTSEVDVIIF